jgi:hypothetical protein
MLASIHPLTDLTEENKVSVLRRQKRISQKVGHYRLHQILEIPYLELDRVVGTVGADRSATPTLLQHVKELGSISVLADREARSRFPSQKVSFTWLERDAEAPFSIYKPRNVGVEI